MEIEAYMKSFFKNALEINLETIPRNSDQTICLLCEKQSKLEDLKENPVVKDHCHLTGKFRGLAHNICNLNTRKAHTSFVPTSFTFFQEMIVI